VCNKLQFKSVNVKYSVIQIVCIVMQMVLLLVVVVVLVVDVKYAVLQRVFIVETCIRNELSKNCYSKLRRSWFPDVPGAFIMNMKAFVVTLQFVTGFMKKWVGV